MTSSNEKPKDEPEPLLQKEGEILIGVDKKLADLMQRGWTLVGESCSLESCKCPLLRSLDGNKYCAGCEVWMFDNQRHRQKYTEIALRGVQDIEVKHLGLAKLNRNIIDFSYGSKENILNSLKMKLAYLSSILNTTTDMTKTQSILKNIKLCIKDIKLVNQEL